MESKVRLVLKYYDGRYLSWDRDHFPLTSKLRESRTFIDAPQINDFLLNSFYRPEIYGLDPSDFEVTEIEISYKELKNDGREDGDATTPEPVPS